MDDDTELQREAVALVKQYATAIKMMPPVKKFFVKLALFLNWFELQGALK